MRLVTFIQNDEFKLGAMLNEQYIIDLNNAYQELVRRQGKPADSDSPLASDMRGFLGQGESALKIPKEVIAFAEEEFNAKEGKDTLPLWLIPESEIRLAAPIPNPSKVVAIGQNYRDHCAEQGVKPPDRPIIFAKFSTSVVGPGDHITWDPELTGQVDYEAELGVVIGEKARNVSQEEAFEYIAGYLNGNDVSARDLQFGDRQWVRGKSLDTFCPIGPYLVTKDEVPDPHNLSIRAILNGNVMQDSNTSNLIFNIPYLIEFITRAFTLLPGDIILTGTPPGVGVFRDPKVLLKPGDTITIEVEHLGTLTNPVVEWKK
jgi:2-keto-4-pentenoate hydratase/2-oxohepta-3-ene-1,7-dioic acid hydratase in catechol pathway